MNAVHPARFSKQRPLRSGSYSAIVTKRPEDVLADLEKVSHLIISENFSSALSHAIGALHFNLKLMGPEMEHLYKDVLDKRFVQLRDGCRDRRLDRVSRVRLLELVELRANCISWSFNQTATQYYRYALSLAASDSVSVCPGRRIDVCQPPVLTPPVNYCLSGDNSGPSSSVESSAASCRGSNRLSRPARSQTSSRVRDEVVIRNSDSGKVMGVKGLRVHKIEQMSGTVVSFQRVPPGSKERLVQIIGPDEASVVLARRLIDDVIRRNASPSRDIALESPSLLVNPSSGVVMATGSDDSVSSVHSDEWRRAGSGVTGTTPLSGGLGQFRYTISVGQRSIKLTGTHANLVKTAKLVLDEYFNAAPLCGLFGDHLDLDSSVPFMSGGNGNRLLSAPDDGSSSSAPPHTPVSGDGSLRQSASTTDNSVIHKTGALDDNLPVYATVSTSSGDHSGDWSHSGSVVLTDGAGDGSILRRYDRATLLLYSRSAVARYAPAGWLSLHKQLPGVVRLTSRNVNWENFLNRTSVNGDRAGAEKKSVSSSTAVKHGKKVHQ